MTESTEIWRQRGEIERAHREFQRTAMLEYERDVYRPALKALRSSCAAIGHRPQGDFHDNGIGWTWRYCTQCGARVDITGPDGAPVALPDTSAPVART